MFLREHTEHTQIRRFFLKEAGYHGTNTKSTVTKKTVLPNDIISKKNDRL